LRDSGGKVLYATTYQVQVEGFEGPLDLLLQLVEKEKVDIFQVSLTKLADEYLAAIEQMQRANLEVGGDFLVMAAQLTYIKSKLLLPPEVTANPEEQSAEEMKRAFLERLAIYKVFQEAAKDLSARDWIGRDVFRRGPAGTEEPPPPGLDLELYTLLSAFETVLKRAKIKTPHEVVFRRLSLTDRIHQVLDRVKLARTLTFEALFDDQPDTASLIITFLAILELAKLKVLAVSQENRGTPLLVSLKEDLTQQN
jgi:segregation and condensation protein A